MRKILHVISSPRGDESYSIKLGNAIIKKIIETYPGSKVKENNLITRQFPHLYDDQIVSFYTPPEYRTQKNLDAILRSDEAISEVLDADIIVIGVPFYNFGIHSTLKAWIDHIARTGVTFRLTENGYEGLVHGKKVYLAIASGGIYSEGAMQAFDFAVPYLKAILGFLGITDVRDVRVEGTAIPDLKDFALDKAIDSFAL